MKHELFEVGSYERVCESCHTYVLSTLLFIELMIIKYFHLSFIRHFSILIDSLIILYK